MKKIAAWVRFCGNGVRLFFTWIRSHGNELLFYAALGCIFAGVRLKVDLGTALIVVGSVEAAVSIATAFFVTGLSARVKGK